MKRVLRYAAAATACAVLLNMPVSAADTGKTYLSEIGSCKRIAGLHEYYEAHGRTLNPDTQFYYNTKSGRLYEISRAGNACIWLVLKGPEDTQYEPLRGHVAALCEQYFGSGYQIEESFMEYAIAVQIDGSVPDIGPSDVCYEIRLTGQGKDIEEKAEALYRTLAGEQYPVAECIYYPEYGYVNYAYPEGYAYNAEQASEITAYLEQNEPDWQLAFQMAQDDSRMYIISKHQDVPASEDAAAVSEGMIYAKVFEALGYWPDSLTISDGCSHDFGIDLKKTVQAETTECLWEDIYGKGTSGYYSRSEYFMTNDKGTAEYYTIGGEMLVFRIWPGNIAFRLTAPDAVSYEEMQALAKKYSDSYSVDLDYDFCVLTLNGSNYDPSCADAIKKELTEKGVITAFYGPGNVATVGQEALETDGSSLFYRYGSAAEAKKLEAVQAWLAEHRKDCTAEDYFTPTDVQAGRTDPTYLRVTPKAAHSKAQLLSLACDIYRFTGIWPQWQESPATVKPVYAVRNDSLVSAEPESKGEPCEWKSTAVRTDADGNPYHEKFWSKYTRFDSKGMFGDEAYISDGGSVTVFNHFPSVFGCRGADVNCSDEVLLAHIQRIAEPYDVTQKENGLILISASDNEIFPEQDVQRIRSELISQGLISEFYAPGEVAAVEHVSLESEDALYYYNQSIRVPDKRFNQMKACLEEFFPGSSITITDGYEIGRMDVSYIKVTGPEGCTPAAMFAIAAGLYEATGSAPLFIIPLPNQPEYAVRNNNMAVTGDMNLDGQADVADAVMIARYVSEDRELVISDRGMKNADTQRDGQVNSEDLTLLLQAIAKKIIL